MGLTERIRAWWNTPTALQAASGPISGRLASASAELTIPPVSGDVAQVQDLPTEVGQAFGINTDTGPISRGEAMRVPAFARGRNIICGQTGMLDWFAEKGGRREVPQLLEQPDPNTTRQHTYTWTTDDLLCYGVAWWHVIERDGSGWPLHAQWVSLKRLTFTYEGLRIVAIHLDGRPVNPRDLIRFDGWHDGVLRYGADVLRGALELEQLVKRFAQNPAPRGWLKDLRDLSVDAPEMTTEQLDQAFQRWYDRTRPDKWLNRSIGYETSGWSPQELDLTGARNQAAVQIARMLGLPSRQVNAPSESGMTYQTVMGDKTELIDGTLATYTSPIAQRLSMPDVTPRGWQVKPDRDGYTTGTTKERIEAAAAFLGAGLGGGDLDGVNEARAKYLGLAPLPAGTPLATPTTPAPQRQEAPA